MGLLAPQGLGIGLSYLFWIRLKAICSMYDETDFRFLKEFSFNDLDLTGAGWCLCLPREEGYLPVDQDTDDDKLDLDHDNDRETSNSVS
ncbi:hypothetical protein GDO86_006560 [Hymenochirus boettgeri]|uniref:Uncharacterized protein n=1 Tax=Hymenochirus boettgeri TaxID=247094 RepID=A0A8T2JBJ3_9PIPI|nr:hypothetical protein GDO86_006560 [Hymenochirus boettgeri]